MFRQGMHDLKVWPGVEGDGGEPTSTPGRTSSSLTEDQMGRLAKVRHCLWMYRRTVFMTGREDEGKRYDDDDESQQETCQ